MNNITNMRVLLVSAVPPPEGGIATWTKRYIKYCDMHNIKLQLVNTALQGSRGKQINSRRRIFDEIKRTIFILKGMKSTVKKNKVDIVHINTSCSNFGLLRDYMCAKEAYVKRIPIVLHCHCNIEDQVTTRISKMVLYKLSKISSVILTLNTDSKKYIDRLCKKEAKIVPNFVDESMICENHLINNVIKEVVFVGHVQETKGCLEIIEAAKKLDYIHFTLVGPVSNQIKKISLPENVSLLGEKKAPLIKNYLSNADVFLFPSYTEGFSLSLTEAMANGLPCIATDVGANKDMIEKNGGIIIQTRSSEAIIEALHRLESYDVRNRASVWNLQKVKINYLPDKVMNSIFSIYETVLIK